MAADEEDLGIKEMNAYHMALGRFVSQFASVESAMQLALRTCLGIQQSLAAAIFSGTRTEAAASYIRRIGETENWPEAKIKELEYIFQQLGEITRVRNDILHYGAMPISANKLRVPLGSDEWLVSNRSAAHTEAKIRETRITPEILDFMTHDLQKIRIHLSAIFDPKGAVVRRQFEKHLERAWLYRPGQPSRKREKPLRKTRKRKPRPQSSPE
jgi:hypothetical protein